MLRDVDDWKLAVLPLRRSGDSITSRSYAREAAEGMITQRVGYNDQSQIDDDILMPKRPFCAHMREWEGYNAESASEGCHERLGKSESVHEDEGGGSATG